MVRQERRKVRILRALRFVRIAVSLTVTMPFVFSETTSPYGFIQNVRTGRCTCPSCTRFAFVHLIGVVLKAGWQFGANRYPRLLCVGIFICLQMSDSHFEHSGRLPAPDLCTHKPRLYQCAPQTTVRPLDSLNSRTEFHIDAIF